jgi:hypothetical protein
MIINEIGKSYSFPQDSMAVTWNDLSTVESAPDVFLDGSIRGGFSNLGLHLLEPEQDFLVGESVQRTSETIQRGTEGQEWIREGRTDQLASVGGNVSTFMVRVDGDVQAEKLNEGFLIAES